MCRMVFRAIASARRYLGRNSNPGKDLPFGETPLPFRAGGLRVFARSARTRRPVGRASGWARKPACRHIGSSQGWCVMKCRGGCLEHKASPTRRGRPLQAVISKVFQIGVLRCHG
jgi:hypothetical protein